MNCICFSLHLEDFLTIFKHVLSTFHGSIQEGNFSYYSGGLIAVAGELPTEAEEEPAATSRGAN